MEKNSRVLVTGASGLIGSEVVNLLRNRGFCNLYLPTKSELDLKKQGLVNEWFDVHRPEYVFHLAAKVGGIFANHTYPAEFIYNNTIIHSNIFFAANEYGVRKVLFPGSACSYPKFAKQPVKERELLNGEIEPTNIAYAAAKINGVVMGQSFAKQYNMNVALPVITNTYGDNDHFGLESSHVIPALIKKIHDAKKNGKNDVVLWGSGKPLREFIHSKDVASALIFLMLNYDDSELINVGTEEELSIKGLAFLIREIVGYKGEIIFDTNYPDGSLRKCLDSSKLKALGWRQEISIKEGVQSVYKSYLKSIK
ncbi:MAG: GDP-L-fucose synthase [Rickettsiales bacterium]